MIKKNYSGVASAALFCCLVNLPANAAEEDINTWTNQTTITGDERLIGDCNGTTAGGKCFVESGTLEETIVGTSIRSLGAIPDDGQDDSAAFELAVTNGGTYYVPPGFYDLSNVEDHTWDSNTVFYGKSGAREATILDMGGAHITRDGGNQSHFVLRDGARVRLFNLSIQNGGDFLDLDGLNGTVHVIHQDNLKWTNTNTWGWSWSNNTVNANAKVSRVTISDSVVFGPSKSQGLFGQGRGYEWVRIDGNEVIGGGTGIQVGFAADTLAPSEVARNKHVLITNNRIRGIDGEGFSSETSIAGINSHATFVTISGNHLEDIDDPSHGPDTAGVYLKSRFYKVLGNTFVDVGRDEGMVVAKGYDGNQSEPDSCDGSDGSSADGDSQCSKQGIIAENHFRNTRSISTLDCVWVQTSDTLIENNYFDGCQRNAVNLPNSNSQYNVTVRNNKIRNLSGSEMFRHQGTVQDVVYDGNEFIDRSHSGTTRLLTIESGNTTRVTIRNNKAYINNGTFRVVEVESGATLEDTLIMGNEFSPSATLEVSGGTVTDCLQSSNRGYGTFGSPGNCPTS
ncbi:MAG: hypothetical protein AAF530_24175 [Pseudomonadota bacterium]